MYMNLYTCSFFAFRFMSIVTFILAVMCMWEVASWEASAMPTRDCSTPEGKEK